MSSGNGWLSRQRKSDLVDLADAIGLTKYVLLSLSSYIHCSDAHARDGLALSYPHWHFAHARMQRTGRVHSTLTYLTPPLAMTGHG